MNKNIILETNRADRILGLAALHPSDFSAPVPAEALTVIRAENAALKALPVAQTTGHATSTGATARKKALLRELLKEMRALRRTFEQVKAKDPSITTNLEDPVDEKDATIIATAQTYFDTISPIKDKFIARGKKPTFLDALEDDIAEYNALAASQTGGVAQREAATDAISQSLEKLIHAIE